MPNKPKSVEELLKQRAKLEAELERYQRLLTVMFTDIVGSTNYFEQHGDLAGAAMLQEVNDRLQPLVRKHAGNIVKTIGDSIMAYFENPGEAVRCAIAMQRAMADYNAQRDPTQAIQVRVALNLGAGLLKDNDVFGDVVNVCSRMERATPPGHICVSPSVVEAMGKEIVCRKVGTLAMRGKAQKMELYKVLWREGAKVKKPPRRKMSGKQLALATGTRLGLEQEVRAAIARAVEGRTQGTKLPALAKKQFALVKLLPDRTLSQRFLLAGTSTVVGRERGDILFSEDPLMSSEHAAFTTLGGALYVEDLASANGVFVRLRKPHALKPDDIVLLGRQMFRFRLLAREPSPEAAQKPEEKGAGQPVDTAARAAPGTAVSPAAELVRLLKGGKEENRYPLQRGDTTFGRTRGTYTFPEDPYLSRTQARLTLHGPRCVLEDLKSTNGSFVRIRERHLLDAEDELLIGGQSLRVVSESV